MLFHFYWVPFYIFINILKCFQMVLDIGIREQSPGITFVALSRVKSLDGLLLEPFSKSRFFNINTSSVLHLKDQIIQQYLAKKYVSTKTFIRTDYI